MSTVSQCLRALVCAAAMSVATGAAAQGKDELWDITMSMSMDGMTMPAQTQRICQPPKTAEEDRLPKQDNCKVTDVKQSGNKVSFKMACKEGADSYSGTGEFTSTPDTYSGAIKMKGTVDGEPMNIAQTFSGKKVGNCTAEDQGKKMQAQIDAATAEGCGEAANGLLSAPFAPGQYCAGQKPKLCAKASQVYKEMSEPENYKSGRNNYSDLDAALKLCGQDPAKLLATACKRASDKKNWAFVAETCEAESRTLAAKHCDGRGYTAAMSSEFAPICRRYAKDAGRAYTAQARSGETSGVVDQAKESAAGQIKDGAVNQIKDGASKLKKFLKF